MLIQFKCKNFTSFKNETVFDMTAIEAYKEHPYNLIKEEGNERYLKVAAIYGANASGKSNFIYAFKAFKEIVMFSFRNSSLSIRLRDMDEETTILDKWYRPYASSKDPVEFEGYFANEEYEFQYGFSFNNECILEEWLYRKPKVKNGRKQTILERQYGEEVYLGEYAGTESRKYVDQVEENVLLLTFLSSLKIDENIFKDVTMIIFSVLLITGERLTAQVRGRMYERRLALYLKSYQDSSTKWNEFKKFIAAIDVGIIDISLEEKTERDIRVYAHHLSETGETIKFPIGWESSGTLKAIMFYFSACEAIDSKGVVIADELDVNFHPLLLKFFVDMFEKQQNKAQLIYTAHDTTLMDKKYFRRDQIWFVEKNEFGISNLYALSDFKIRQDAAFEKDYLGGVYGAIPILKEFWS